MAEANKIDSNVTNARIAEETTLGVLPASPTWYDLEPNTYADFGSNLTLVARNPISARRKRKKGVITDLDAAGGFNQDLTFTNISALWPGLFLSQKRQKTTFLSDGTGASSPINGVDGTSNQFDLDNDQTTAIRSGDIIFATGFGVAGNNGLHVVSAVAFATGVTTVTVGSNLTDETTAPDGARLRTVGFQFADGEADITATAGSLPVLTAASKTMSELGLRAGEFVFLGADTATTRYSNAQNNGFARVESIGTNTLTFDKTSGGSDGVTEMTDEAVAGGTTVQIFFGDIVRDEDSDDAFFDRQTYTIERRLGVANPTSQPTAIQSEALVGSVLNEFAFNIPQADKITLDFTFLSTDNQQRDGLTALQRGFGVDELPLSNTGTVATVEAATAYNTSSDFSRIKLAVVRPTQAGSANKAAPIPLFSFVTEVTLNFNNNGTTNKGVGRLGAFDVTAGTFTVSGSITAYFADINSVKAVRNNQDVTLDIAIVKDFGTGMEARKTGLIWDIPLIALGDGRLNVVQDEAITLPLTTEGAEYEPFGHTAMLHEFFYLPNAADT